MPASKTRKIVVIGGGTGTFTVLSGLKQFAPKRVDLTAIVTVADSGGSTGRLRDEFGYLPVGDFRMALAALADTNGMAGNLLRELFLYRFTKGGKELAGHNFGNLFLVAMTDILGSEEKAIEFASKVLRVRGRVLPVTHEDVTLIARYADGTVIRGETHIDEPPADHDAASSIVEISLDPRPTVSLQARQAVAEADVIILGPGDLYTSLLANVVVGGMADVIANARGRFLYISNLMTKYGQTSGFALSDHIMEMTRYIGRSPDYVLVNDTPLPEDIKARYNAEHEYPVRDDLLGVSSSPSRIVRTDLLATEIVLKSSGDALRRSLIRHDSDKLAKAIMDILTGTKHEIRERMRSARNLEPVS